MNALDFLRKMFGASPEKQLRKTLRKASTEVFRKNYRLYGQESIAGAMIIQGAIAGFFNAFKDSPEFQAIRIHGMYSNPPYDADLILEQEFIRCQRKYFK